MFSFWMLLVFAYCIWIGKIFAKRCEGHWLTFWFLPTALMFTTFFSLLIKENIGYGGPYLMSVLTGCIVGLLITNPVSVKIDLVRQNISAPGSWLVFIGLMVLCISKVVFEWLNVSMPKQAIEFKIVSFLINGGATGLLYGQALSFYYRYLMAEHRSKKELKPSRFAHFCGLEMAQGKVYE
jgi:hypothetical protein